MTTYHTDTASAGYVGVFHGDAELSAHEQAARLNAMEETIAELRALLTSADEIVGQAIALLNQGHTDAALSVLYDALRRTPTAAASANSRRG